MCCSEEAPITKSLAIGEERIAQETPPINFGPIDLIGVIFPHSDALIISATIANNEVVGYLWTQGTR